MAPPLDPYRTLGLAPGASVDEIRRAYRKLAKTHHPDSAGEGALPRFLAIQAAYEMLMAGRTRPTRSPGRSTGATAAGGAASRADPARSRATRDAYSRSRRAGPASSADTDANPSSGPKRGPAPGASPGGERPRGSSRSRKKATLGSTSYDAAEEEPFEPEWQGGSWYGAGSGTYWTLNPKEYADPRKHGPEYQRRARRRLDGIDPDEAGEDAAFSGEGFDSPGSQTDAGPDRQGFDGRWRYPEDESTGRGDERDRDPDVVWTHWSPDVERSWPRRPTTSSIDELVDRILGGRIGVVQRLVISFIGSAPIVAVVAWLVGEISGCGRFTATCGDPSAPWALAILLAVWGILAALPQVAAISAGGLVGALLVAVPASVILSAGGGSREPETSVAVLNVLAFVGYVIGVVLTTARRLGWRRVPSR